MYLFTVPEDPILPTTPNVPGPINNKVTTASCDNMFIYIREERPVNAGKYG
jgi:hypothetical protein